MRHATSRALASHLLVVLPEVVAGGVCLGCLGRCRGGLHHLVGLLAAAVAVLWVWPVLSCPMPLLPMLLVQLTVVQLPAPLLSHPALLQEPASQPPLGL